MSRPVVLYGASELGRDAVSLAPALAEAGSDIELVGFVDDDPRMAGREILGLRVLGGRQWLDGRQGEVEVLMVIGEPRVRRRLVVGLTEDGHRFATVLHPSTISTDWVRFGSGTLVMAGCTFTVEIEIGDHAVFNPGCTVAHDVRVGDYAYISPGVDLAGAVEVGDGAFLGTGVVVLPHCAVGPGAVVGAGAVVTRDIPADEVWVGVPARHQRDVESPWSTDDRWQKGS